jgi:UTP-glucose-1-phosphate uridylyltransferase
MRQPTKAIICAAGLGTRFLPIIAQEKIGVGGEMTLADSLNELAINDTVYDCFIDGVWHDTGD